MLGKIISNVSRAAAILCASCAILAAALLLAAQPATVQGAHAAAPQASRHATPPAMQRALRDMFNVHAISEAAISPDGRRVAWVESLSG
ncbi:MAG TPA: hypothetical protein VKT50_06975, partial [Candidatus Acidoferrales bacterium]|nr:hypothetical protein [Candidatus Acidoferrales bacterium]